MPSNMKRKCLLILLISVFLVGCSSKSNQIVSEEEFVSTEKANDASIEKPEDTSETKTLASKEYTLEGETISDKLKVSIDSFENDVVTCTINNLSPDKKLGDITLCVCGVDKDGNEFNHTCTDWDVTNIEPNKNLTVEIPIKEVPFCYEEKWNKDEKWHLEDAEIIRIYPVIACFMDGTSIVTWEEQEKVHSAIKKFVDYSS